MKKLLTLNGILAGTMALIALTLIVPMVFGAEKTTWDTEYPSYTFTDGQKAALDLILQQFGQKQDLQATNGISITNSGKGITIATNTASTARMGSITLVAGTRTLTNSTLTTKTHAFYCRESTNIASIVFGNLSAQIDPSTTNLVFISTTNTAAGVSVINASDTSTLHYILFEGTP